MPQSKGGSGEPDNRIDEQFIRDSVDEFLSKYRISYAELGRVLGYQSKAESTQTYHGRRFVFDKDRPITLRDVDLIAEYMRLPPMDLIRPVNGISSEGDRNRNVVQQGHHSIVNEGTSAISEELLTFLRLSPEERSLILSALKHNS
ncbi:MAG: hypothetical protein AAF558_00165 [Verrucomicrobiota bacterium]